MHPFFKTIRKDVGCWNLTIFDGVVVYDDRNGVLRYASLPQEYTPTQENAFYAIPSR